MTAYPLPTNATENITGIYTMVKYINNDVSGGVFALMILLAIFIIIFIALKNFRTSRAFVTAAFINMILAIIMRTLQLISNVWMYLSIILVGVGVIWLHSDNASGRV